MPASQEEVFAKVRTALVDALGVDEDEVTPEATIIGDLGAESIDFLDIVFRLEKAFGIEIPRSELTPEDVLTNPAYVKDGKVTPEGIAEIKRRMPFADLSKFEANPVVTEFGNLLTVNDLCRFVESKVKFGPQWFLAIRWNQQLFGKIADAEGRDVSWGRDVWRIDVAPGYRFSPHTQLKVQLSLRHETPAPRELTHSIATQLTIRVRISHAESPQHHGSQI